MKAPLVLFCNNNQWAISTPLAAQTAAETLADKAVGYGMPASRVDGGDVLAVFEATREAVARARAGDGPTFIEAVTYRAAPHATADDPTVYIDPERVEEERRRECVGRFEGYLRRRGLLPDELRTRSARRRRADARGIGGPRPSRIPTRRFSSHTRTPRRRAPSTPTSPSSGGSWRMSELTLVEAVNDALHPELRRDPNVLVMGEDVGRSAASSARPRVCARRSARIAASTRRSPRPASSAPRSASAWRAGGPSARCSTTPSATPASTS